MSSLRRRLGNRAIGSLLIIGIALMLSGCSNPSDAASLKSGNISIEKLQASVSKILEERITFNTTPEDGLSGEELTRNTLGFHIFSALLKQAAKERNVVALPGDISTRRAEVLKNVGGEQELSVALVKAGIASTDFEEYLALIVLQDKLRQVIAPSATEDAQVVEALQKMLSDTAASENLSVNPRYGVWNTANNRVEPADATGGALPSGKQ